MLMCRSCKILVERSNQICPPFEALPLMFVAGNFVITLLKFILELVKETKNSRPNFGELTSYFLVM